MEPPEPVERHDLPEVDGGTWIERMSDGGLRLRLDSCPPAWARGPFDSFQQDLERALGVRVVGLDRELFAIPRPGPDTLDAARRFLVALRHTHARGATPE
jgi:hypothetical protein